VTHHAKGEAGNQAEKTFAWVISFSLRLQQLSSRGAELAEPVAPDQSSFSPLLMRGRDGLWINGERRTVHHPALIVRKSEMSGQVSGLVLRMTGPAGGSGSLRTPSAPRRSRP
jgi:hypothetical protein